MSHIFAPARLMTRRSGWIVLFPALAVCSGDNPAGTTTQDPGTVSDLTASAPTTTSISLSFTQVADGSGQAANYDVRYAVAPITLSAATSVASGACASPVAGTGVGSNFSCTIGGLSPSTSYDFLVIAFRGTLNAGAVFGGVSNVAAASTTTPPPNLVVTTVSVSPPSASVAVGATMPFQATVKDQNGNVMTGQNVTWTTNDSATATVNSSGVVTGVAAGSVTITATSAGKSGTSNITVTGPPLPAPVVTTVTVTPSSASVQAGVIVPLQATVRDQNGNVMSGETVAWTTNNTSAATVNSSGVVTGVAAGSATITATSSGKSGTSSITVTAGPPPPPPRGTILFQEDFDNTSLASRGWYDNTSVLLSTAEYTGTGSTGTASTGSAQYRFLAGATTPTTGGAQRHKFTASTSVYISYNVKFTANWVGSNLAYHPHEIQVMSDMDGDFDGPSNAWMILYLEHSYQNGGKPRLMMQDNKAINSSLGTPPINLVGVTEDRSTGGCNGMAETNMGSECFMQGYWFNNKAIIGPVALQPNPGPGYKNDWNFVEAYFQLNTVVNGVGQANGVMQYWFNDTLIIDRHDILYRTGARPNLQFNQFLIAPYIGDGSPVDQSMWIDNLRVATGRIP